MHTAEGKQSSAWRPEPLPAGTLLHDYFVVVRRIAVTMFSSVYLGYDRRDDQPVAIKRLSTDARPAGLPRAGAIAAFTREAQLLGELRHPQFAALRAIFDERGDYFMVMDYIAGVRLDRLFDGGAMTPDLALAIGAGICRAVAALHAQSPPIVHADIKPANIILAPDGEIVLLDLGLARRYSPESHPSDPAGTPPYTPPEQWRGEPLDQRSDIYALGMLLDELFVVAGVRAPEHVLARATAAAPGERFESVDQLRRALFTAMFPPRRPPHTPRIILDLWTCSAIAVALLALSALLLHTLR